MEAFIHWSEGGFLTPRQTVQVPVKRVDAPRSGNTASGYGKRLPTQYMVELDGRWRRVYCCLYSNNGTCYIGKFKTNTVQINLD
jgi:hypothetical protein